MFNLLWLDGYEPEISYLHQNEELSFSVDAAFEKYAGAYEQAAKSKGIDLYKSIEEYAEQGLVKVGKKSTLAMILWKVK